MILERYPELQLLDPTERRALAAELMSFPDQKTLVSDGSALDREVERLRAVVEQFRPHVIPLEELGFETVDEFIEAIRGR